MRERARRLRLPARPAAEEVGRLGPVLRELLRDCYGPTSFCDRAELAAVEVFGNVAAHSRGCRNVVVRATCLPHLVRIVVCDDGARFDMTAIEPRLPADPLAERGRGLWIVRNTVDRFRYRRLGGCNVHAVTQFVSGTG